MSDTGVDLDSSVIGTNGKAIIGLYAAGELEEAPMVTTALTITRCSMLYLVASLANIRRRPSSAQSMDKMNKFIVEEGIKRTLEEATLKNGVPGNTRSGDEMNKFIVEDGIKMTLEETTLILKSDLG